MYTFRPLKEGDIDSLKDFLKKQSLIVDDILDAIHHCLILEIEQQIEGFITGVYSGETEFLITHIYIAPEFRKQQFGEGIVKAYLNMLDLRGVKCVCYRGDLSQFFKRLNFIIKDNNVIAKLPDYFNSACHSKVSSNDIN